MERTNERRAERRLRYRWPVRFAGNVKEIPFPGQMVDVSSRGMAILCHANKNCPHADQLVTAHFGAPYFDLHESFDTVFFTRIGRVCRVDRLSSQVHCVAIQFAEPLFFRPGEQNISESDAQQRLEAKAQVSVKAEEQARSNTEKDARAHGEALARAEERIRSYVRAKAETEEKLRAEIQARYKAEAESRAQAEEKIRAHAEARARAEERAKTEAEATAKAEAKAKTQAMARAKAEKKARAEVPKRIKLEAQAQEKAKSHAEQIAKVKAEAAEAIAKVKTEAAERLAEVKAEFNEKLWTYAEAKTGAEEKAISKAKRSGKSSMLKKVDKIVTDKNRIFGI